ncbi:hypothetical protein E2C01_065311 [Portunus trituberculatus]|uniref:Uncharacterized protein n=1 Tax=Portunus trituberculatus TaxID=210409 RepID=A0A5B7HLK0_PORTR|nr:hypothetical protein [Portunus trituberculatus]
MAPAHRHLFNSGHLSESCWAQTKGRALMPHWDTCLSLTLLPLPPPSFSSSIHPEERRPCLIKSSTHLEECFLTHDRKSRCIMTHNTEALLLLGMARLENTDTRSWVKY